MPPEGEVGRLNVPIRGDLRKFEGDLKRAEAQAKKGAAKIAATAEKITIGGITGAAMKATASFGAIELGLKSIGAATAAIKGDFAKAAELVKQLPAGIGPAAQALEFVLDSITGTTAAVLEIQRQTLLIDKRRVKQAQQAAISSGIRATTAARAEKLEFEARLAKVPESRRPKAEAEQELILELRKTAEQRKRVQQSGLGGSLGEGALASIRRLERALRARAARLTREGAGGDTETRRGSFRQLDRGREAIGGIGAANKSPEKMELEKANETLASILRRMGVGTGLTEGVV